MLRGALIVLVFSLAGSAAPLHAQSDAESADSEAHALFEAGRTAYSGGRFQDALAHFQNAYDLSHRPELLYNIGQCHDRLRHDTEALAALEQYVREVPNAPQRAEVEARIEILRQALASQPSTTTDTTTTETQTADTAPAPEAQPAPSRGVDPAPWIVLGAGGVVAIVGAILVGVAFADISTVNGSPDGARFSTVQSSYDQAPILSGVGWASLGVGVALAAVGLVWALTSGGGSEPRASLRIGPSQLSIAGTF